MKFPKDFEKEVLTSTEELARPLEIMHPPAFLGGWNRRTMMMTPRCGACEC